jgi:hypothetical protein
MLGLVLLRQCVATALGSGHIAWKRPPADSLVGERWYKGWYNRLAPLMLTAATVPGGMDQSLFGPP